MLVDTNILVSALLSRPSLPAHLIAFWRDDEFDLLTTANQIDELIRVARYPKIRARVTTSVIGRLINDLRNIATMVGELPPVDASVDPDDNYLLATVIAGSADRLVTRDRRDLLRLKSFGGARIVSVREFLTSIRRLP